MSAAANAAGLGGSIGGSIGDDELIGWLRLTQTLGIGPATCRALLAAFGMPVAVLAATRDQQRKIVPLAIVDALRKPPPATFAPLVARTRAWLAESGNHLVTLADTRYPPALLETADPPPLLYVKGRVALLAAATVAIVGSRNATPQGAIDARRFAESLAAAGQTIISGLALGIDAAAHEGALAAGRGGGSTVAVIGTGADIVYPSSHRALARRIAEHGAIVSELPLGTPASAHQFPRRNRIIAGMARGVLVIEAAARSGSLITARLASECGRDVFAVPGSIHSPLAKGCHQLIRQGAKLVESVEDVLDELQGDVRAPRSRGGPAPSTVRPDDSDDERLIALLGFDPISSDELGTRSGWSPTRLAGLLLDLEMAGRIARLPGGRVQRIVA
ncbi:MAG: DNA-processing protein DprA [Burkholderiaceae bacterium]